MFVCHVVQLGWTKAMYASICIVRCSGNKVPKLSFGFQRCGDEYLWDIEKKVETLMTSGFNSFHCTYHNGIPPHPYQSCIVWSSNGGYQQWWGFVQCTHYYCALLPMDTYEPQCNQWRCSEKLVDDWNFELWQKTKFSQTIAKRIRQKCGALKLVSSSVREKLGEIMAQMCTIILFSYLSVIVTFAVKALSNIASFSIHSQV